MHRRFKIRNRRVFLLPVILLYIYVFIYVRNTRWIENRPCNREDRNRNNSKNRSWPTSLLFVECRTNRVQSVTICCTICCDKNAIFHTNFSKRLVPFLFSFSFGGDDRFVSTDSLFPRDSFVPSPTLPKDGNLFESETFENCFQERLFVNGRWFGWE